MARTRFDEEIIPGRFINHLRYEAGVDAIDVAYDRVTRILTTNDVTQEELDEAKASFDPTVKNPLAPTWKKRARYLAHKETLTPEEEKELDGYVRRIAIESLS